MTLLGTKVLTLHQALAAARIPHALGGAIALAYGVRQPRATDDIDLNVFHPVQRADAVVAAFPAGIRIRAEDRADLARDGQVRLRWDETPVDLFFSTVDFHRAAARRIQTVPFERLTIPVLSATDLTVCKAVFGRPKDWVDIEAMRDAESVDPDEALRWTAALLGKDHDNYGRLDAILATPPTPVADLDQLPPTLRRRET